MKAAKLAAHFASGSRAGDSPGDAYFDNAGQDLLAGFLLAAALENLPITQAFTWTTTPGDDEPVRILRRHGYDQMADAVSGQVNGESRRRDSVYGTAAQMASCLKVRAIAAWVTPQGGGHDPRPQFDPHAFVRSTDTLYSLSKEGRGTAGPLVTALTAATVEAAEEYATTQPGGRLQTPMLGVLDEAANVCRWHDLPDLYSHYGSRGIVLMTILQSWSQGGQVWGRDGMRKLWSASNVAVYGGGVKEPGHHTRLTPPRSRSHRPNQSTSRSTFPIPRTNPPEPAVDTAVSQPLVSRRWSAVGGSASAEGGWRMKARNRLPFWLVRYANTPSALIELLRGISARPVLPRSVTAWSTGADHSCSATRSRDG